MPATEAQWDEIQALKEAHKLELANYDEQCRTKRIEMEAAHNRAFDRLYMKMGARRERR